MKITFIGHGYVGLVTAAIFADLGNTVYVIGHTKEKIENLKKGILPIYEPGLSEIVTRNVENGRLIFTLEYSPAVSESEVVFIAVGTPPQKTGDAELTTVFSVAEKIAKNLTHYTVVVTKSTVPPGTNRKVKRILEENVKEGIDFDIASVPEFLREGSAIEDTLHPDRVIIGTEKDKPLEILKELHKPMGGELVATNLETAELIKYASNSFLATKISFANAIAKLAEKIGANAPEALHGIGLDKRIGEAFLYAGAGYGGSCFPKDVKALLAIAKDNDYNFALLDEVEKINDFARRDIVKKVKRLCGELRGKTVGILGLSFKPNTDDMRDASSITIINLLKNDGVKIKAYDPQAMENSKKIMPEITYCKDPYEVAKDADAICILTEWNEFRELDLEKIRSVMKTPNLIDGRNIYAPSVLEKLGFNSVGVGR
ncbi:MAG TPA: UDP-glucose/GDP-mannose dehydrogenase family protein [Candidatus Levybacteria bacterium]|nr:UDP-glucose/GDP-mannose dehydrogenase family protein [Candidatus Levybacteria bacterium]